MPSWPDAAAPRMWHLAVAGFNVARLPPSALTADLSTDAGPAHRLTTSDDSSRPSDMSALGGLVEAHLGTERWRLTGSGRGAETVVAAALIRPRSLVLANEVYVSGRWWIHRLGGRIDEIPTTTAEHDPGLAPVHRDVAFVQLTLPPSALGPHAGQSVSLQRVQAVRRWINARLPDVPLVIDASRLWENADADQSDARAFVEAADIVLMSTRKDLGASRGGLVAGRDARWWPALSAAAETFEGPRGGLDDESVSAVAAGFRAVAAGRAAERRAPTERLVRDLDTIGLPIASSGCGSVYLDAARWLPRVDPGEFPAQTLLNLIFVLTGWRGLGTSIDEPGQPPFVRLAVRDSADLLRQHLPYIAEFAAKLDSGIRPAERDRVAPYLAPAEPADPRAWPQMPATGEPISPALWLVGRTPWGYGPQRALGEALASTVPARVVSNPDPVLAGLLDRLAHPSAHPRVEIPGVDFTRLGDFRERSTRHGRLVVVDIESPANWPEVSAHGPADVFWASGHEGGLVAVAAKSVLAAPLDRSSLFTMGTWLAANSSDVRH